MTHVLVAEAVAAGYHGRAMVEGLDLAVAEGELVGLFGANGAGKTTTLLALAGELTLLKGEVRFGESGRRDPLYRRARNGLAFVLSERATFTHLTVAENFRVARCDVKFATELFPELEALMKRRTGLLSGGEQQMVSVAAALARRPRLLMIDELSLGLAPLVVARLMAALRDAAISGISVLIVEQHVRQALAIADHAYVLRRGRVVLEGSGEDLRARIGEIEDSYLSGSSE